MSCFSLRKFPSVLFLMIYYESVLMGVLMLCDRDNKEGVQSFMQKRPAKFSGTMDTTQVSAYPWWVPIDVGNRAKAVGSAKPKI